MTGMDLVQHPKHVQNLPRGDKTRLFELRPGAKLERRKSGTRIPESLSPLQFFVLFLNGIVFIGQFCFFGGFFNTIGKNKLFF